jgi:hypothetical protein
MKYILFVIILISLGTLFYVFVMKSKTQEEIVYESVAQKEKSIKERCEKAKWTEWACDPISGIEKRTRDTACYPSVQEQPCTRNCKFSNWGKWLCIDNRKMIRKRTIQRPAFRGGTCEGDLEEMQTDTQNMCVITTSLNNQMFEDGDFQSIVVEIVGAGGNGGNGSATSGGGGGGSGEYRKIILPYADFWDKPYSIVIGTDENSDTKFIVNDETFISKPGRSGSNQTGGLGGTGGSTQLYSVEIKQGLKGSDGSSTGLGGDGANSEFGLGGKSSYLSRNALIPGAGGAGGCSTNNPTGLCARPPVSTPKSASTPTPTPTKNIEDSIGGKGGVGGVKISYIFRLLSTPPPTFTPIPTIPTFTTVPATTTAPTR